MDIIITITSWQKMPMGRAFVSFYALIPTPWHAVGSHCVRPQLHGSQSHLGKVHANYIHALCDLDQDKGIAYAALQLEERYNIANEACWGLLDHIDCRGSSTRVPTICFFSWCEPFSLKPLRIKIKTVRWASKRETVFDYAPHQRIDCTCQLSHANQS